MKRMVLLFVLPCLIGCSVDRQVDKTEPKEIEIKSKYTISVLQGSSVQAYHSNEIFECRHSNNVLFIEAESGEEITLVGCQVIIRETK